MDKAVAHPFIKWAGGKSQLLNIYREYYPKALQTDKIAQYIEPFVGGGAVLLDVLQRYNVKEAFAFDINWDLINAWEVVKTKVDELIALLTNLQNQYAQASEEERKKIYYTIRHQYNVKKQMTSKQDVERAAQFIFLNHTGYNGLYRENKFGLYNVPMGRYKNPKILNKSNLRAVSNVIQRVTFLAADYSKSLEYITPNNSFVYLDPPYRPVSKNGFTSYCGKWTDQDQIRLAQVFREMDRRGVFLMLSNSDPHNTNPNDTFFDDLYSGYYIYRISARRSINANGKRRNSVSELLITNYEI